jgi:hypothetical protein
MTVFAGPSHGALRATMDIEGKPLFPQNAGSHLQ